MVLYTQSDVLSAYQDMNLASRGYALSKESLFLDNYRRAEAELTALTRKLRQLVASNPNQQDLARKLGPATDELEKTSDAVNMAG